MTTKLLTIVSLLFLLINLQAQSHTDQVYVDDSGIMRWSVDNKELYGFGVNYTLPFAHEYRMAKRTGISLEEAIRQDVYHMARLDLDLFRVHAWDTEISDTLGNLINNEHLKLLDFAINEMKNRGIWFIITPIAYWGNGWPEKDEPTPGFSYKYGKGNCLTNTDAIKAQANYLNQFLNHVNPYTGIAYKDEPQLIGFEICNEPHHSGPPEKVTDFINTMVASMRQSGCTKPIFYNITQNAALLNGYLNADIQGVTFQWYPTNLVANHQINGNFLPQVSNYKVPFTDHPKFKKMAKIVYEFDAADVGGNVMYPVMARSFREAGMQLAAQFAYDAMCTAPYNTNYGTHFMNLAYAPQKAISLKIASAIFHTVPMYRPTPDKTHFDGFRINYTEDLTESVASEKFFYSNNTSTQPGDLSLLKEIAGCGSSPLVNYSGTGAYFLDKLSDGLWRLEVMPDAYWIDDPYSPVSPNKQKAAVLHTPQMMKLNLPDLGNEFTIKPINQGNTTEIKVLGNQFTVVPGVYLINRNNISGEINTARTYKNIRIDEFVAPISNLDKTVLWNHSPTETLAGKPLRISFETVSSSPILKVQVVMSNVDKWRTLEAKRQRANLFTVDVPADLTNNGFLNYRIMVEDRKDTTTFPVGFKGNPWSWENKDNVTYTIRLVPESTPLVIWNAETDWETSYKIWNRSVNLKPTSSGETSLTIRLDKLPEVNPLDKTDLNYAFKYYFGKKIHGRANELPHKKYLVVKLSNYQQSTQPVEVGLIDQNGSVMAGLINVSPKESISRIPLKNFKTSSYLAIPRPFPEYQSYKIQTNSEPFDWSAIEMLQLQIKPGKMESVNMNIEKIWLE